MDSAQTRKRRNAAATRARILEGAKQVFAEKGYADTGIRDIAALAGITAPMLLRYFGSKAGIFEAALRDVMDMSHFFAWERSELAANLSSSLTSSESGGGATLPTMAAAMIALSTGHPEAREIATRVAEEHVIRPTAKWLGPPNAYARAAQLFLLSTGLVLYRYKLPLNRGRDDADAQMIEWYEKAVQDILDQSENRASPA